MQNNIQAFNEGRLQNNLIARENFDGKNIKLFNLNLFKSFSFF